MPRGEPTREPMTPLDKRCILALEPVRGMSDNAARISGTLLQELRQGLPITLRMRHALYAICWRFRRQLAIELQVKVAIALADAAMAAQLLGEGMPDRIRGYRAPDRPTLTVVRNPLDGLFTAGAA